MGDVVNLRQARKQRARVERERLAAESRVAHGRSKAEQLTARREHEQEAAFLEGHRREKRSEDSAD
jgi:hypothetical protein